MAKNYYLQFINSSTNKNKSAVFKPLSRTFQVCCNVGNCYDNARMESFFATLKKKLYRINTTKMTVEQVKSEVFRSVCLKSRNLQNGMNHDTMAPKVLYTLAIQSARSMNYEAVCQS